MFTKRATFILAPVLAPLLLGLSACQTITNLTPASSEVSLTTGQSDLHKASDAYCLQARERGLATGEASIGSLTAALTGKSAGSKAYMKKIGVGVVPVGGLMAQIRTDASLTASGLVELNRLARDMMRTARPNRTDVTRFELALIHGRQARISLADALAHINETAARKVEVSAELAALDAALIAARMTADSLAEARTTEDVASRPAPTRPT